MRFYLINLDRSSDRLEHMTSQFAKLGADFVKIPAVDGREMPPEALKAVTATERPWAAPLTPTEIGCFLSHRRCLEAIARNDDPYAVVVEDDVIFADDAGKLLLHSEWVPHDADIVKIETQGKKVLIGKPIACASTRYSVARLYSVHILAAGYIVSRDAARRIVAEMEKVSAPIDHFLFNAPYGVFNQLSVYQCTPALCKQAGLTSTLQSERSQLYQKPPFVGRVLREIKRTFKRAGIGSWGIWVNLATTRQWVRIPFRPEV
ncbi:lipooligosaccharide biosynthesis protein lic2B [Brucella sp. NF 2653]|uniref:glycosyltransferase family 25 protein n=1 Tax=unclassified Brucella TaxID=2632610 RepID=UPI0001BD7F82|nr:MULTISPECIES: glycosyltransferase family 25 protein [unclassified Brucella]EEZ33492.1 glycosyl transferase [Brucella sp. 83/13]EFM63403.1 lipooligosaccharide biosynthesis protein lic2B [Brucella sp. NF 2653]